MSRKFLGFRPLHIILIITIFILTLIHLKSNFSLLHEPEKTREQILKQINDFIKTGHKAVGEGQVCKIPTLDVNAPDILSLLKHTRVEACNTSKDWVEVDGSTARITTWAQQAYGMIECAFTDILRENDSKQYHGVTTTTHLEYNLEGSDVVKVSCRSIMRKKWNKILLGVRSDQDILDRASWSRVPEDSLKLNVLMIGLDSLSHNMWKRLLPKTYKYATTDLGGIALNGYNIVGDGTPQALIPILTGKTELELPETRKRMGSAAQYVNVYPFIWNDFQKNGYVTLFGEDMPHIGTFTYRLKGFKEQPVDHYARTFYMETPSSFNNKLSCYGELSKLDIMLNYIRNMYKVYKDKPKFMFAFYNEYSHDQLSYASNADDGLTEFLQDFNRKGYLNGTMLILMSDHGSRFSDFRSTQQGKQEERLPGFIFILPSWFKKKYPEEYSNFKKNADRLTTPFDIYETFKNVLHFEGGGTGDIQKRGISLFKQVPLLRSCQDAGIEPHWCTCLDWETISVRNNIVIEAVSHLVDFINSIGSNYRHLCAKLRLKKILKSSKLVPNNYLLKFKISDSDGLLADLTSNTPVTTEVYQVQVVLSPGDMLFEASVRYVPRDHTYYVSEKDISRINKYKHMTHCIEDRDILHHLRKYCYCH